MIAVYLAMLETDVDRDKFMKLYESYEKKLFAVALTVFDKGIIINHNKNRANLH